MKKLIALLCLLAICLPLCACASPSLKNTEGKPAQTATVEEQKQNTPAVKTEKFKIPEDLPEGFAVGYGIIDITGKTPISYFGGIADGVHDPLMLTCTAVSDGETVALIMTADLKKMLDNVSVKSLEIIEKQFGIPASNVILSCTHSHSAPDAGSSAEGNPQWMQQYYKQLPLAVDAALRDLDVVEKAYAGTANTEHPIGFVRRYLLADGTYKMNPSTSDNPVSHESVADPELRTIRFDRKNKKDVLLVNFRTHYGGATSTYPRKLSADFVHPFRQEAQKAYDCLFAYYSGASGNINFNSAIPGERYYETWLDAIDGFMETTDAALKAEEEISLGKIQTARSTVAATVRHDPEERVKQAQEIADAGYDETEAGRALMEKYGFDGYYDASFTVTRSKLGESMDVALNAIAFGDVAFTGYPYEMFHENGKEVRDASPYKMTFICSLSLGAFGYIPSALGYSHGGYETYNCRFVGGTGEQLAQESVRLLNECKSAGGSK